MVVRACRLLITVGRPAYVPCNSIAYVNGALPVIRLETSSGAHIG
jgi:hypothetical protein